MFGKEFVPVRAHGLESDYKFKEMGYRYYPPGVKMTVTKTESTGLGDYYYLFEIDTTNHSDNSEIIVQQTIECEKKGHVSIDFNGRSEN